MRDKKFREASAHASGEVSASAFLVGHLLASRLRLRDIFLIARHAPPAMQEGQVRYSPTYFAILDSCA